jgi:inner membrane protein
MENVAHSVVGLLGAKAGLDRLSPGATSASVIAANLPDADIIAGLGGKWFLLQHHRGITHSILGVLVLPILLTGFYSLGDLLVARIRSVNPRVRFWPLLLVTFLMGATHPVLDWTNNYGIRPLLPWDGRWFYGDLVFIVDPWIWLFGGGCVFLATSFSKVRLAVWSIVGVLFSAVLVLFLQRSQIVGSGILVALWFTGLVGFAVLRAKAGIRIGRMASVLCLIGIVFYWCGLGFIHRQAMLRAEEAMLEIKQDPNEMVRKMAVMPTFADPRNWLCVAQTNAATYKFPIRLSNVGNQASTSYAVRYPEVVGDAAKAVAAASADPRAKVLLGFARFPVEVVEGDCITGLLVQLADLRYTEPGHSNPGTFGLDLTVSCDTIR